MSEHSRRPHNTNAVQRALAHPLRAHILTELEKRAASPSQIAEAVGESVGVVSYHMRVLAEAGLAELVGTVPRRGALQHFYAVRDTGTVGTTLMLDAERADGLRKDMRELVDQARRSAERQPGHIAVTVVLHAT